MLNNTLSLVELKKRVEFCLENSIPVMLVGYPGTGKSEFLENLAKERKADYVPLVLSTLEPTEIMGFPFKKSSSEADFLPYGELKKILNATKETVVHLEDFIQGSTLIQKQCMTLIRKREVKGKKIPDCVKFVICTNDATHNAGGGTILSPILSRTSIYRFPVDWKGWIIWGAETKRIDTRLLFYIRTFPDALNKFSASREITNFPCPRTWEMASDYLRSGFDDFESFQSVIGGEESARLVGFLEDVKTLGGVWGKIEKDPQSAPIFDQLDRLYAMGIIVANNATKETLPNILSYLKRYDNNEVTSFIIETTANLKPELKETPEYIQVLTA